MEAAEASRKAADLNKTAGVEWMRLRQFQRYIRGRQTPPWLPDSAETEYREIARKSASNWLGLVVQATAQGLHVDGYGDKAPEDGGTVWADAWQANNMDAHQHALHRAVLSLGYSYLIVLPSDDDGVWMRPEAATKMYAVYDDPFDEWPQLALRQVSKTRWELYDDENRYLITGNLGGGASVETLKHGLGVCPVVQMRNQLDLLGTPMGEIEPVMRIQDRIIDATFTLQMVAKYGAFPQRWIAGIDTTKPLTDADGETILDANGDPVFPKIKAYVDHIITAIDNDTKFGQFTSADLRQYVEALEAHIRHLAAITQTPPHYLLGSLVNLSAEALAAAEAGLMRKIRDRRATLGEGYEQALRLAAGVLGDEDAAMDTSSQVHWQDVESRSLAQVADALVKLKGVGVPTPLLFEMIPGWTKQDVDKAEKLIAEGGGPLDRLVAQLEADQTPAMPEPPALPVA
jgi:hypothetical protein